MYGAAAREQLAVPRGGVPVVLRAAGAQAAGMGLEDRGVPVRGWAVGGFGDAGGRGGPDGAAGAAAGEPGRGAGEHPGEHVLPRRGPGPAGAVPSHAAGGEAELADERGHVDPVGVRPGRGTGRGGGVDAGPIAADVAGSAGGLVGEAGWAVGGWDGAGGGVVHGSSVVADGGSGVAGGAPVSAVRVHGLGRGERRGLGMVFAPVGEAGPARRMAVVGAGLEVAASRLLEQRLGLSAEAYTTGKAHRLRKWSEYLTVGGALGAVVAGRSGRRWLCRAWRCWPGVRCSGSACSRRGWSRPATRSMWWCRSGNASMRAAQPGAGRTDLRKRYHRRYHSPNRYARFPRDTTNQPRVAACSG